MTPTAPSVPTNWSPQAQAVFAWFGKDTAALAAYAATLGLDVVIDADGHLIVRARAGTGKTTAILHGIDFAPEKRILLAAFNKRIQEELNARLTNPAAEAKTLHGVGYACVRRYWEKVGVDTSTKRGDALAQAVCGDQAPDAIKRLVRNLMTKGREIVPHATALGDLTNLAFEFDLVPDEEWEEAGFDLAYVERKALEAMELAATKKPLAIDFADMLFLPVRKKWLTKTYDLVVVDEAQDMTVTQLELARGVCKGRLCLVGDDRQGIYGFRGADSTSLDRLKAELKAGELPLSVTYRCPTSVVARAKVLVPDYEAAASAPEGSVTTLPSIEAMVAAAENIVQPDGKPHDFILSRTNAPLAKVAMKLLRSQKRVRIQGKDIGAGLKALTKKLLTGRANASIPQFLEKLTTWEEREIHRAIKAGKEEAVEGIRDRAETLRVLTDGVTGPRELEVRLDTLFSDEGNHGTIVCSSVHKAKGLEAKRVFVLADTLFPVLPKRVADKMTEEQLAKRQREEENIAYVAYTRAMESLVLVSGK